MKGTKTRLIAILTVIAIMVAILPVSALAKSSSKITAINAEDNLTKDLTVTYETGWGQAWTSHYTYLGPDGSNQLDSILPAGIGFTILAETEVSLYIHTTGHINVWISRDYVTMDLANSEAGTVTTASNVYGAVTNGEMVGSVSVGNTVSVLASSSGYYFIEFNDSSYIRKRGWVSSSCISSGSVGSMTTISGNTTRYASSTIYVYYAPGTGYSHYTTLSDNYAYTLVSYTTIHGHDYALISFIVSEITGNGIVDKLALGYIEI